MEVLFWTFPHMGGKWSIAAGDKTKLECAGSTIWVRWVGMNPVYDGETGTRWIEGKAVQQGVLPEKSGGSVDYYKVTIPCPTSGGSQYIAECNDVIEALGMNYAEGNAFKALWRSCAARTLGKLKDGGDSVYDAEKVVFFGERLVVQRKGNSDATQVRK